MERTLPRAAADIRHYRNRMSDNLYNSPGTRLIDKSYRLSGECQRQELVRFRDSRGGLE